MASRWVWYIFQFPEISGLRAASAMAALPQRPEPGQIAVLEVLEGGAATGRHVVDLVTQPEPSQGAAAVAPAAHRETLAVGGPLGHGLGPGRKTGVLEDAHGPVPEHRPRLGDVVGKLGRRARTDVQAHPAVGHTASQLADLAGGLVGGSELAA